MSDLLHRIPIVVPLKDEYVSQKLHMRLFRTPDFGWRSYTYPGGDVIEDLSNWDVFDFIRDPQAEFEAVNE